ncbi:MAG TPA: DUF3298 domain-containing protein [Chitinophagaceae bacterium]|nr:DUF3298 domain-containing protein [Chitinophagaceae bacterium]
MRLFYLFLLAGLFFPGPTTAQSKPALSWYKTVKGTIGAYPVTLHLHKQDTAYSGCYYYESQQDPIIFNGTALRGDSIRLYAHAGDGEETGGTFLFRWKEGRATGTWEKEGSGKLQPFQAQEAGADSLLRFDYVYTTGSRALRPKWRDSPAGSYEAAAVWPVDSTGPALFVRQVISQAFGEKKAGRGIGAALLKQKRAFLDEYAREHAKVTDKELKEYGTAYTYESMESVQVQYLSPRLLTLVHHNYSYTGGAHGNYGAGYTVIDLQKGKVLELKDVLTPESIRALPRLLEKHFRKSYGVKEGESLSEAGLFENKIEPNDNFYLTGKGILFSYQPYEIGPYVMGQIEVFIPFAELQLK